MIFKLGNGLSYATIETIVNFPFLRKMASTLPTDISESREVASLSFEVVVAIIHGYHV